MWGQLSFVFFLSESIVMAASDLCLNCIDVHREFVRQSSTTSDPNSGIPERRRSPG